MTLQNLPMPEIPASVREAVHGEKKRARKKKPHPFIAFADAAGNVFEAADFTEVYSALGSSNSIHPGQLAMATLLQSATGLSDRQASEQLSDSLVWKYCCRIDLNDDGWEHTKFSDFRNALRKSNSAMLLFEKLLDRAEELGLLNTKKQRTDSMAVLSAAKLTNRIELVFECIFDCLNELCETVPKFVMLIRQKDWKDRYFTNRAYNYQVPKADIDRKELTATIGKDAEVILSAIDSSECAVELNELWSVKILRRVIAEQYAKTAEGLVFRDTKDLAPAGERISSPHDVDATCSTKRGETWMGSRLHITETYDPAFPRLVTNVLTTPAHVNDSVALPVIHEQLREHGRKPDIHTVDTGYSDSKEIHKAREQHGIDVHTVLGESNSWQARAGKGFDLPNFSIDFENKKVTCPQGFESGSWKLTKEGAVKVAFKKADCKQCPFVQDCTKSKGPRELHFKQKELHLFMEEQRARQKTNVFREEYSNRSGVEGTVSIMVGMGIRRSRYFNAAATAFSHVLAGAALNLIRVGRWIAGYDQSHTRKARYEQLFGAVA